MPLPVPPPPKEGREREQAIFDGWLAECAELQDLVVEQLILNLPSFKEEG